MLNKKGMYAGLIFWTALMLAILIIVSGMVWMNIDERNKDNACEDLGMDRDYIDGNYVCIDNKDIAHLVTFDCGRSFSLSGCKARLVTMGGQE